MSPDVKKFFKRAVLFGTAATVSVVGAGAAANAQESTTADLRPFILEASSEGPISAFPANPETHYRMHLSTLGLGLQVEYAKDCAQNLNTDGTRNCTWAADHYRINLSAFSQIGSANLPSPLER